MLFSCGAAGQTCNSAPAKSCGGRMSPPRAAAGNNKINFVAYLHPLYGGLMRTSLAVITAALTCISCNRTSTSEPQRSSSPAEDRSGRFQRRPAKLRGNRRSRCSGGRYDQVGASGSRSSTVSVLQRSDAARLLRLWPRACSKRLARRSRGDSDQELWSPKMAIF